MCSGPVCLSYLCVYPTSVGRVRLSTARRTAARCGDRCCTPPRLYVMCECAVETALCPAAKTSARRTVLPNFCLLLIAVGLRLMIAFPPSVLFLPPPLLSLRASIALAFSAFRAVLLYSSGAGAWWSRALRADCDVHASPPQRPPSQGRHQERHQETMLCPRPCRFRYGLAFAA